MEEKDKWLKENNLVFGNIYDNMIVSAAYDKGIRDINQIRMALAISRCETGNYTHFVAKNNFGGLLNWEKTQQNNGNKIWFYYDTTEKGIERYVGNLKDNYFDQGLLTVDKIWAKYAPNDKGQNPNWGPTVTELLGQIGNGQFPNMDGKINGDPNAGKIYDSNTVPSEMNAVRGKSGIERTPDSFTIKDLENKYRNNSGNTYGL
jgi:hypothetical protein